MKLINLGIKNPDIYSGEYKGVLIFILQSEKI